MNEVSLTELFRTARREEAGTPSRSWKRTSARRLKSMNLPDESQTAMGCPTFSNMRSRRSRSRVALASVCCSLMKLRASSSLRGEGLSLIAFLFCHIDSFLRFRTKRETI